MRRAQCSPRLRFLCEVVFQLLKVLYLRPFGGGSAPGCRQWFKNVSGQTQHFNAHHASNILPKPAPRNIQHRAPTPIAAGGDPNYDYDVVMPDFEDGDAPDFEDGDAFGDGDDVNIGARVETHRHLDGKPCDIHGVHLPAGSPPPPPSCPPADDYSLFGNREEFEIGDFLYRQDQMSGANVDKLMALWAATLREGDSPPFASNKDMQEVIDASKLGDVAWQSFTVTYSGPRPAGEVPPWMLASYEVWFRCPLEVIRNQLSNPDFASEMDFCAKKVYNGKDKRQYRDFMSGDWGWKQSDILAEDSRNHGATLCPIIGGSDKTTVSVATGQHDYYPFYLSNGLITNGARRAHREGISLVAFLSIPKRMTEPLVMLCADGHYCRIIFGLGPYIADYPEQVLLACIVQNWCPKYVFPCTARPSLLDGAGIRRCAEHTDAVLDALGMKAAWEEYGIVGDVKPFTADFPRADIHELLSPDLLHQIIKGTFKDHLVGWVNQYLVEEHGQSRASAIIADIDRQIAAAPSFPGLRRFSEGRGFKQWTGDDSKALMKVYLPAIAGHVPSQMVRALSAFLEFCYLVRRSTIDEDTLVAIDAALACFHVEREIFRDVGVRPDGFSLPRQHSMVHYVSHIKLFGAPNGLCSSITESKHIKAVKDPYRRTNHNEPLGQMLLINQRLDKLAAVRVDFTAREMLNGPCLCLPPTILAAVQADALTPVSAPMLIADPVVFDEEGNVDDDGGDVDGPTVMGEVQLAKCRVCHLPRPVDMLAATINIPRLQELIRHFLYDQQFPDSEISPADAALASCPRFDGHVTVFPSAVATFYAPSDLSGIGGMHRERIRSTSSWRFRGLYVVRVLLFFQFISDGVIYPCALVSWFSPVSETPCPDTGMWIVEPDLDGGGERQMSVIHIDCILRGAHLIGVSAVKTHQRVNMSPGHV
ncbi:hypothetical protein OF83DRAFT_1278998 [Amylostereum chailletii]|nr:hypothetical protein OF83DRAFT_1278998 [Amylostereum chailletii]